MRMRAEGRPLKVEEKASGELVRVGADRQREGGEEREINNNRLCVLHGPLNMTEPQSALLLRRQLAELNKNPVDGFSAGLIDDNDLYRWEVLIIGPPDTLYEGGVFKAHLTFPKDYPLRPPKMKFITEIWHPNVDKNGEVCISILHEPGEDKYGYEKPEERWLPIHTVETILISVISMLADPNGDSPANVDAAKEWREDRNGEFKRKVARCVRKSQETAFE
ncbi:ubiquitin-conjugating enzyme E2 G1a [Cetorhinus maximus]